MTSFFVRRAALLLLPLLVLFQRDATAQPPVVDDPVVATFQQEKLTIKKLEEFARELPSNQRVPWHLSGAGDWRRFIARELAKCTVFSKNAIALGRHLDPVYLRAR